MIYDYHTHTTFSDGLLEPEALISLACERGIGSISVTDHDLVSNYSRVKYACDSYGLELIRGIEISSRYKDRDVHLLAYFENESDYLRLAFLEKKRTQERINRLNLICRNLNEIGIMINPQEIISRQNNQGVVGRPQIARLIIEKGYAENQDEVFIKFLGNGTAGYVPTTPDTTEEMIKLVNNYHGVPVLAHPGSFFLNNEEDLLALIYAGLQGIECYCPSNNEIRLHSYLNYVRKYCLVATGGSDFHGIRPDRPDNFGYFSIPEEEYLLFKQRLKLAANNQ